MPEHYTKSTVEASIFCRKCGKNTPWVISGGRRQYCKLCQEKREAESEERKKTPAPAQQTTCFSSTKGKVRPRKKVLLIDSDEANISATRLMLYVQGFAPIHAVDVPSALPVLPDASLVLVYAFTIEEGDAIALALKDVCRWIPVALVVDPKRVSGLMRVADATIDRNIPPVELLEVVKRMSRRKRGPRKTRTPGLSAIVATA